jgi:hypothetical protein
MAGAPQVDRDVLGQLAPAGRRPVDPDGAGEHEPARAGQAGGFQDPGRALDVQPDRPDRIGGDVVDVRRAGQMEDGVGSGQGGGQRVRLEQVRLPVARVGIAPARADIQHGHVMTGVQQVINDM